MTGRNTPLTGRARAPKHDDASRSRLRVDFSSQLASLTHGPLHSFGLPLPVDLPRIAAGVYTVWKDDEYLYAGMAGRALVSPALVTSTQSPSSRRCGLADRLRSHASGRRSGDQFNIYVADRLVLPRLLPGEIASIGAGTLKLDDLTKGFIREHLGFRVVVTTTREEAFALEREARRSLPGLGAPVLNPLT